MAILKYISYYYPWYRKALEYVIYRHDEETKEPILDANGNRMRREDFLIDGLNCTPLAFPLTAKLLNDRFRKNQEPGRERFMCQYIISYNPKDKAEGLLDTQRAHELSMQFIRECFPGLVGIACTHGDGDHHAGNIHTHFYFCTVKCSYEISATMQYPETAPMGNKFKPSPATMREYREKLAELVKREGLHPDNMLGIAGDRITNGEYWIRDYGQKKLDEENQRILKTGGVPAETVYRTEKQRLRDGIFDTASRKTDFPSFRDALLRNYGILLVEDRRGWRYGFCDSNRSFSAVTLGGNYRKEAILDILERNREDPWRMNHELELRERQRTAPESDLPDPDSPQECLDYLHRKWRFPYAKELATAVCLAVKTLRGEKRAYLLRAFPPVLLGVEKMEIRSRNHLEDELEDTRKWVGIINRALEREQGKLREARNRRYWGTVLLHGDGLRQAMESASDLSWFRREHEGELLELEHAETVFAEEPGVSRQSLWENVKKSLRNIARIRSELEGMRWFETESLRAVKEVENFDALLRRHPMLKEAIRKSLERSTDEHRRETEPDFKEKEEAPEPERHLIPPDYER